MAETKPIVTRDPRFLAGRELVERGLAEEAVEIYATLLEETRSQHGDASIETAPAYYEYGNTLLRALARKQSTATATSTETDVEETKAEQRAVAATAAERRINHSNISEEQPSAVAVTGKPKDNGDNDESRNGLNDGGDSDDGYVEDLALSLEMIENSFSILEEYKDGSGHGDDKYLKWVQGQLPRVLMGIGDALSKSNRHADAADAYSRGLELRKACLEEFVGSEESTDKKYTTECLKAHRMVCEANILIAEELLSCPEDEDVVTTETKTLIVKADERVSYARGYYDQARDALQDTIVCMGSYPRNIDLGREKEDVCFLATLVMGVGEELAVIDEKSEEANISAEPLKKKAKK